MTKKISLLIAALLLSSVSGWAQEAMPKANADGAVRDIDSLYKRAAAENYRESGLVLMKEAVEFCLQCMEERPADYEILWRCARAAHQYAETARNLMVKNWEAICEEWGRKGMEIAEKAQGIDPNRVEAYFWETACIGDYSDGSGLMTAIKEGFYKKSKRSVAKAYEIDKSYNDYDPVFASAMFWVTLPFPLRSKKKALRFYREFEEETQWRIRPYVRRVYGANLLMEIKPKGYKEEAKALLDYAVTAPHLQKYYREWVRRLRAKLE